MPSSRKTTRSQASSTRSGRCSETTTAAAERPGELDRLLGALGVELRGRLVEQQAASARARAPRRGRRAAAHRRRARPRAAPRGALRRPSRAPSPPAARSRAGGVPRFSSPKATSAATPREHDLVLGILEERGDLCPRARRAACGACRARRPRRGRRNGRRGNAARARPARAAASTSRRPTGRARRPPRPPRARGETPSSAGPAASGYEKDSVLDATLEPQRPHDDEQRRRSRAPAARLTSRRGAGARVAPGRP